jgi:glucosamine-6-phosphate deaminase
VSEEALSLGGRVPVTVYPDEVALGRALAGEILTGMAAASGAGQPYMLGCPGGRSLRSTYHALGGLAAERGADLSGLVIVMMDDYVLPAGDAYVHCPADAHYSCRRFAREEIRAVLNGGLPEDRGARAESVWFPDPADPASYDARLAGAGGVDLFLIASGASDGHVAFNPPGSAANSTTRIIPLADTTRRDNLATFPDFAGLDEVPHHGVSVGLGTIAGLSNEVVLVMHGEGKREAVRRLFACKAFTPDWPASVVFEARKSRVLLDESARRGLDGDT